MSMRNFESQTFYYYCNYRVSFCFIIYIHMNGNHMNNDRTLSLSTVTHIINCSTGEGGYLRLAVQPFRRRISELLTLAHIHSSRHNHERRWTSNENQRRDNR